MENSLKNILEARSLIRFLKANRQNLPRIADVRRMADESANYLVLCDEAENTTDRWRKAYLEFALTRPAFPSQH